MDHDQNHDDRIHGLFAQIAADPAPPLGFTADGIADAGRRGARTRRVAAVGGATAGIAAVGLAVAALPGPGGSGRATTATTTPTKTSAAATSSPAPTDPACESDVAKAFAYPDPAGKEVALQECPALRAIDEIFDPAGRHLVESNSAGSKITPDIVWGTSFDKTGKASSTSAFICYNNTGPATVMNQGTCTEQPVVFISVTFALPGAPDPEPQSGDMTLADRKPGVSSGSAPWIEKSSSTLKDGSKVTVGEVQNGDRVAMKARRVLPSGASLTIVAFDGYDESSATEQPGSVYDPFPFSIEQMAAAASVEQFVSPDALTSVQSPGPFHPPGTPVTSSTAR